MTVTETLEPVAGAVNQLELAQQLLALAPAPAKEQGIELMGERAPRAVDEERALWPRWTRR